MQYRRARVDRDRKPFDQLRAALVTFTLNFELLPGRKPAKAAPPAARDPMQVQDLGDTNGG